MNVDSQATCCIAPRASPTASRSAIGFLWEQPMFSSSSPAWKHTSLTDQNQPQQSKTPNPLDLGSNFSSNAVAQPLHLSRGLGSSQTALPHHPQALLTTYKWAALEGKPTKAWMARRKKGVHTQKAAFWTGCDPPESQATLQTAVVCCCCQNGHLSPSPPH